MWGILWTFIRCFVLHIPICTRFFLHICLKLKLVLLESLNYIDLQWLTIVLCTCRFKDYIVKCTIDLLLCFSSGNSVLKSWVYITQLLSQHRGHSHLLDKGRILNLWIQFWNTLFLVLLLCFPWIETTVYWLLCRNAREASEPHSMLTVILGPPCSSQHFIFLLNSCKRTVWMVIAFLLNIVLA